MEQNKIINNSKTLTLLNCDNQVLEQLVLRDYLKFPKPVNENWENLQVTEWKFNRDSLIDWDKRTNEAMAELLKFYFANR